MQKEITTKRLLFIKEASIYLGRSVWGVRELVWSGKLPCVRFDKRIHLDIQDLERVIREHKVIYNY